MDIQVEGKIFMVADSSKGLGFGKAGAFLLSPAASFITGVSLVIDGGILKTVW